MSSNKFQLGEVDESDDGNGSADSNGSVNEDGSADDDGSPDYSLSENKMVDLVKYSRSRIAKNEAQSILVSMGYLTGLMQDPAHYCSGVIVGTSSSGKSKLQQEIAKLFDISYDDQHSYPDRDDDAEYGWLYEASMGSDKSIIYDDMWDYALIANLDELNKPSEELIEILKGLHGDDEQFIYKVTGEGEGSDRGTDVIVRTAKPYWFLYAQSNADFEMWNRLLKVPVHESKSKNQAVHRLQWDHSNVAFSDDHSEYIFEFMDGFKALKNHIKSIRKHFKEGAYVKIPAGEEEYGWDAASIAEPIFDIHRSETNRSSAMIANQTRASALLNHTNREMKQIHVPNKGTKNAIIAEPQDLANILCCRDVLLATTHELDDKKMSICEAIDAAGGMQSRANIPDIIDFLRDSNAPVVKRPEIERHLQDLIDNYLVEKYEGAGNNGENLYEFDSWTNLGRIKIDENFKRVFDGCIDPISGRPFEEVIREQNKALEPDTGQYMTVASDEEIGVRSKQESGGQSTLDSGSKGTKGITLEPHQEAVRASLEETLDGKKVDGLTNYNPSTYQMVGVVDMKDRSVDNPDIGGSVLDPDHTVWDQAQRPDDWVDDEDDALAEVDSIIGELHEAGVFQTNVVETTTDGEVEAITATVLSEEEL